MTDTLKNFSTGLGSYVALGWMVALTMSDTNLVFALFVSIVVGWMTSGVTYYTIKALEMMYAVASAMYDTMHSDGNRSTYPSSTPMFEAYTAYIYYKAKK